MAPAQRQEQAKAARVKLDERIHAESVNPRWAREQEEVIRTAMADDTGDGLSVPFPQA